jgi:hypothetical protein
MPIVLEPSDHDSRRDPNFSRKLSNAFGVELIALSELLVLLLRDEMISSEPIRLSFEIVLAIILLEEDCPLRMAQYVGRLVKEGEP